MKREISKPPWIYSFYPILCWYECMFCNQEFRREYGWKVIGNHLINGVYSKTYVCSNCASSPDEVKTKIKEKEDKFKKEFEKHLSFYKTGAIKIL